MGPLNQDERESAILETASQWLVRLASDDVTEKERCDFEAWLLADQQHQKVFADLRSLDTDLNALGGFAELDPDILTSELLVAQEEARELRSQDERRRYRLPTSMWYGIAATISLFVVGLSVWTTLPDVNPPAQAMAYTTLVGEQDEVMLADGSIVWLNTRSSLSVAFTDKQRTIFLTAGEAYFQVAKDADRPFVVFAGDKVLEAVGTAFSVYHRDEVIRASVVEGTVAFGGRPGLGMHDIYQQDETGAVVAQRIDRGQSLIFHDGDAQARVYEESQIEHVASWRQGKLHFNGMTLAAIIKEVNYYIPQRIVIADQSIAEYRGSGVFRIDNAESVVKAFEAAWPVRIEYQPPDLVLLYSDD